MLKKEIRAAIALHRPFTVQEASELIGLQEMELELAKSNVLLRLRFGILIDFGPSLLVEMTKASLWCRRRLVNCYANLTLLYLMTS